MDNIDSVTKPDHYPYDAYEPFKIIEAYGLNFFEGSALKYLLRWRKKNGVDDLKKLAYFVEYLIQKEEK